MSSAPLAPVDPFAVAVRPLDEPGNAATLRAAGPIVQAEAPAGGPVWIITEEALARQALADDRLVKDPAWAPRSWNRWAAGLEPTAAEQLSLTTLDGPAHTALRRAHTPLLSARRVQGYAGRIGSIARELLTAQAPGPVDLMDEFTTRFPLAVICELLGVPDDRVDQAIAACRQLNGEDPAAFAAAMAAFSELAEAALASGDGMAVELRERVPEGVDDRELHYLLFGLIFASQITTDAALGFLLARVLADGPIGADAIDGLVTDGLRRHPPAPFTLWRFTRTALELSGVRLPERAPVLVDIAVINTAPGPAGGPDLTFGAGPHFCVGAQLAQLELRAVAEVLVTDFPRARLAVPYADLRRTDRGMQGSRLTALPVLLRG
ncbi:cytochrome P450 [Pseudonocardia sp. MH-G8]|uniref:cytochrome P450 n=1 Tax=Pseudonocardia sp. MH-G8 TaxID=1854588 RepID=UPI000BA04247|nr:cytochrome P450 [Pseudonocardia sp. MH-G8]OZM76270.1 cytochrome P450 [Pseudonocardia sp. MH-G8]